MTDSEGNQRNLGETSNSLKRKRTGKKKTLTDNQTKLLMIFAQRGYKFGEKYGDYELGLGLAVSSKYDCLIFKYAPEGKDQKSILLQTKYETTENNNASQFIAKGNISKGETLITYFCTYLKAKEKPGNVDSFVIATNICCNGEEKLTSRLIEKIFQFQKIINNNKDVFPKLIFGEHLYKLEEKSKLAKMLIAKIKKKCNVHHQKPLPDVDQMIFTLQNCMESGNIFNEVESFLGLLVYSFNQQVEEKVDIEFPLHEVCTLKNLHEAMLDYRLKVDKTFISKVEIKEFFKFTFNKINALQRQEKDDVEEENRISKRKKIVAPLNGIDYQTILLMYFAQRCHELSKKGNYDFFLRVDWEESGKFDDIVISYKDNDNDLKHIFMQVKHSEQIITESELISKYYKKPFQLFKYFISFLTIKPKFSNLDCCVIATNADFDATENRLITQVENGSKVRFCLQKTFTYLEKIFEAERNPNFYTFQITELIVDDLEKNFRENYEKFKNTKLDKNNKISLTLIPLLNNGSEFRDEIVNFLEKLVFSVKQPNGQELYGIIRESIGKEFYITDSIILDKFYRMIVEYRQTLKRDFLTGTDIDNFFKHMKQRLQNLTTYNTYYSEIKDLNIDYKINNEYLKSLEEFLVSKDESKCQVITKHHSVTLAATQVISLFEQIRKSDLSNYTYNDKFRIFSLGDLLKKTNMEIEAIECFTHGDSFNLLIIICDTNKDSKKIFSKLDKICKSSFAIKKKVLYVTTTMFYETLKHVDRKITIIEPKFSDFTEQSQDSLLKKIISFQGSDIKLKDLFTSKQLLELKSDTLEEIIENKVKINKPVCLNDLEGAFKIHSVKITGEQLVHALTQNFDQPVKLLINGINQLEMSEVIENCCGKKFVDQICSFNKDNILNKMIHLNTDDTNSETEFKLLCEKFPKDFTYEMKHKNNVFELKQLYKPNFYISRHLCQEEIIIEPNNRLKEYFLSSDLMDLFIFSSISVEQLVQIFEITKDEREKLNENLKENIKIVTEEGAESTFKTHQHYKSCYLLKFNSDIQVFTVQRFSGSLNKLRIFSRKEQTKTLKEEEQFFDDVKTQKVVILINEPGMGKSTTLSSLTQKRLETNWVIRINLKHCNNGVTDLPINLTEVVEFLCKIENLSPFARDLATSTLLEGNDKRPLLLLFDGFDELKSEIKDNIISLLKFIKEKTKAFMWITSRKHEQNILQNSLSVFCTKLGKLNDTNKQKSFLEAYWKPYFALVLKTEILSDAFGSKNLDRNEPTKFDIFSNAIFNRLKTNSSDKQDCFVIPLIMVLLADKLLAQFEAFINSQVKYILEDEHFDIATIYKSFVQGNYNKYYERKLLLDTYTKHVYNTHFQGKHWGLAFTQIFPNYPHIFKVTELHDEDYKELLDVGLIQSVDSTPERSIFEFRHRSFAEYFVAELFANQLNDTRDEETYNKTYTFVMQHIFRSRNLSVHDFLENILKTDKGSGKCESINHYNLLKNVKKISTLQLFNSSRSCSDLINDIKKIMNGYYYNGDEVLVHQLLFKFYDEKNDLEITAVKNFLKEYKDKCLYGIVNIQITRIFNVYISKCIELKLKFDDEFIENILRTKQKYVENPLTKRNQIDINCLERLLKNDKYDRIYPLLMNIFLALEKPFLFEGNIEKMLNEWYMERDRHLKIEGNISERIQWLEKMGIYVSKSLLTLTPEMAKIFKSVLPDSYINGWHRIYAKNIFNNLILYLLNYSHLNLNINKSALLDMFQRFVQFCSINKIRISQLNTKELEFVLNCIKCVVNKSSSGEDLRISVLCLICLGSFNLNVIEMEDKLLIQDPDQEFEYELVTTLKEEIVELICCEYENDNFEKRCNEIADDIKR